jgi:hypothetical protein
MKTLTEANKCKDCASLSARDVFSGVCVVKKQPVLVDEKVCERFSAAQRCKFCSSYETGGEANLGTCKGSMVYPDLGGCENFSSLFVSRVGLAGTLS